MYIYTVIKVYLISNTGAGQHFLTDKLHLILPSHPCTSIWRDGRKSGHIVQLKPPEPGCHLPQSDVCIRGIQGGPILFRSNIPHWCGGTLAMQTCSKPPTALTALPLPVAPLLWHMPAPQPAQQTRRDLVQTASNSLVPQASSPGAGMPGLPRTWMLQAACWILNAGCWMLHATCYMLDSAC